MTRYKVPVTTWSRNRGGSGDIGAEDCLLEVEADDPRRAANVAKAEIKDRFRVLSPWVELVKMEIDKEGIVLA